MIEYSKDAEPARAFLLKNYNDIDVFVEDTSCQNMYVRLINRMLGGRATISQVFPLHSRSNVLAMCAQDQAPRARKRIYIIDADQDLMRGVPVPKLAHLHRLNMYCSENLLLSEYALITVATECDTNCSWPEAALRLNLKPLLENAVDSLFPLFIAYAIVKELGLTIQTVNYSVVRLLSNHSDPTTLSQVLIRARIFSIVKQIINQASRRDYILARNKIMRRLQASSKHKSVFISGKTYLLQLAYLQLKNIMGFNEAFDRLKMRLAQYCELSLASGLKRAIVRELK